MARRILSLVLILVLLPAFLAVPAKADDGDDDNWVQLLDYSTMNDTGTNFRDISPSGTMTAYTARYVCPLSYVNGGFVDIIFRTDATNFTVTNSYGNLTVLHIEGDLYRAYGTEVKFRTPYFTINTDNGSYIECLSFKLSLVPYEGFTMPCALTVSVGTGDFYYASYNGDSWVSADWDISNSEYAYGYWSSYIRFSDGWQKYDHIDILLTIRTMSIESITVDDGTTSLPFEVNYILQPQAGVDTNTVFSVRIDLRQMARTSDGYPILRITGVSATDTNHYAISSCTGLIEVAEPSQWVVWFNQLESWITTVNSSVTTGFSNVGIWLTEQTTSIVNSVQTWGGNIVRNIAHYGEQTVLAIGKWGQNIVDVLTPDDDASQLQDDLNDSLGDLQQAGAVMDSVARPDINAVNINVAGMISPSGLTGVASIVNVVTGNALLGTLITMSFTMALISFIIFGKR